MKEQIKLACIVTALALLLTGCATTLIGRAIDAGQSPTPEQVDAWRKAGQKVYACFNLSGPPPNGGVTWIIVPGDADALVQFSPTCALIQGVVR